MKIIPIFFYHEKWAVIMRKFVYSPDGVEKMGPLRGDGNRASRHNLPIFRVEKMGPLRGDGNMKIVEDIKRFIEVEKMGPLRGDGNHNITTFLNHFACREDGSPSWGRKLYHCF